MISALIISCALATAQPQGVTIERATIPWNELERLLKKEGAVAPRPGPQAPLAHSISNMEVTGTVGRDRAQLHSVLEIEILGKSWVVVPLLPKYFAVSSAKVLAPEHGRGILVRDANGVSLVAKGEGNYQISAELEGPVEHDKSELRLSLAPPGLATGRAQIKILSKAARVGGRTRWRTSSEDDKSTVAEAALGAEGMELIVKPPRELAPPEDAGAALEELRAVTVVSLGGRGATRISVLAKPGANKIFEATLPESAKLFKAWSDREGISPELAQRGTAVKIPLERAARIELAYTFEASRLGVRGAWHVELPKLAVEAQGAAWDVWLPNGLDYQDTQSSMAVASSCTLGQEKGLTKIDVVGRCFGFARPVLEPGVPYAEGAYRQPF